MNIWTNTFHKTEALSTLSQSEYDDAGYRYQHGYINSTHKDYRKARKLEKKLCPHNNNQCSCRAAMQIEYSEVV